MSSRKRLDYGFSVEQRGKKARHYDEDCEQSYGNTDDYYQSTGAYDSSREYGGDGSMNMDVYSDDETAAEDEQRYYNNNRKSTVYRREHIDMKDIPSLVFMEPTALLQSSRGKKMCIIDAGSMDAIAGPNRKTPRNVVHYLDSTKEDASFGSKRTVRANAKRNVGAPRYHLPPKTATTTNVENYNKYVCAGDSESELEDYISSASHEYDEIEYNDEMFHVGVSVDAAPGRGCAHRNHCPSECPIYHDYRVPGRRHYHVVSEDCISIYRARYGRYVREMGTSILVRLDSDDEDAFDGGGDDEEEEEEEDRRKGWRHFPLCDPTCAIYHSPESPHAEHYARSRDNVFYKCREGRYIKQLTSYGTTYIRLGPNDEDDYDYEKEPALRRSMSAPPLVDRRRRVAPVSHSDVVLQASPKKPFDDNDESDEDSDDSILTNEGTVVTTVSPTVIVKQEPKPVVTTVAATTQQQQPLQPRNTVEIDLMTVTAEELFAYMQRFIKHQDLALMELVKQFGTLMKAPIPLTPNIVRILATGVSGTGKSSCAVPMRRLFGMSRGSPNECCFVECALNTFSDASHCNRITGPGPGYIGYGAPALVNQLLDALAHIRHREQHHHQSPRPKIIFLLLDEIDKTVNEVYDCLNTLLEKGELIGTQPGNAFRLPDDVFLVIYSTANFGEFELDRMEKRNLNGARDIIQRDMKRRRIADCNIRRMGTMIPFFGLSKEQAISTIMDRLAREAMAINKSHPSTHNHYLSEIGMCCEVEESELRRFVEYCVRGSYQRSLGIAKPIELVEREINANTFTQDSFLKQYDRQTLTQAVAKYGRPKLKFRVIPYDAQMLSDEHSFAMRWPEISGEFKRQFNMLNIRMCILNECPIAYFEFTLGPTLRNINILSPLVGASGSIADDDDDDQDLTSAYDKAMARLLAIMATPPPTFPGRHRMKLPPQHANTEEEEEEDDVVVADSSKGKKPRDKNSLKRAYLPKKHSGVSENKKNSRERLL